MCIPEVGRGKAPGELTPEEKKLQKQYADIALDILRTVAAQGFSDWGYLQIEVDYDALRPYPEFQAIVAKFKDKAKQR
jgi:hypothetical protein